MKKNYKITTIIPIYNVVDYLEDAIKSVIRQSIGFEENIELILINDGSPDDSERICKKYLEKYPNNIVYKKKKNGGVSSARNLGFKLAHGEYINFFDGDDIWDKNAYKKGIKMLDENPSIDLVAFRIKFFEKFTTYHHLDYKFTGNRIIDLKVKRWKLKLPSFFDYFLLRALIPSITVAIASNSPSVNSSPSRTKLS